MVSAQMGSILRVIFSSRNVLPAANRVGKVIYLVLWYYPTHNVKELHWNAEWAPLKFSVNESMKTQLANDFLQNGNFLLVNIIITIHSDC